MTSWKREELDIINQYLRERPNEQITAEIITNLKDRLPNRTHAAVKKKIFELKTPKNTCAAPSTSKIKIWTIEESNRLAEIFAITYATTKQERVRLIEEQFPGRSQKALATRLRTMHPEIYYAEPIQNNPLHAADGNNEQENDVRNPIDVEQAENTHHPQVENNEQQEENRTEPHPTSEQQGNAEEEPDEPKRENPQPDDALMREFNKIFNKIHSKTKPTKLIRFFAYKNYNIITKINACLEHKITQINKEVSRPGKKHQLIKKLILTAGYLLRKKIVGKIGKTKEEPKYQKTLRVIETYKDRITSARNIQQSRNKPLYGKERETKKVMQKLHATPAQYITLTTDKINMLQKNANWQKKTYEERKQRQIFENRPSVNVLQKTTNENKINIETCTEYYTKLLGEQPDPKASPLFDKWTEHIRNSAKPEDNFTVKNIEQQIKEAIKFAKPWKAPGADGVPNYLYKVFPAAKKYIADFIKHNLYGEYRLNADDVTAEVVLIHKSGPTEDPQNYRPISLLNTDYKLLTKVLKNLIEQQVTHIIPQEQLARAGIWGTTHGLLLDKAETLTASIRKSSHCTAWYDFTKAYDSLYHTKIREIIQALPINDKLKQLFRATTRLWNIKIRGEKNIVGPRIRVMRGVYQGDSLSGLTFVLTTAGILYNLKHDPNIIATSKGYMKMVAYMDDLKCHTNNKHTVEAVTQKLSECADEIGLQLNIKKCATLSNAHDNTELTPSIPELQTAYKYLGIEQSEKDSIDNIQKIADKVVEKAETILKSKLTTMQKKNLFNSTIIPAAIYITGNLYPDEGVRSTLVRCRKIDQKVRQLAIDARVKSGSTSNQRFYLSPKIGGLGFRNIENETALQYIRRYWYLINNEELKDARGKYMTIHKRGRRTPIGDFEYIKKKYNIVLEENWDLRSALDQAKKWDTEDRIEDWSKTMLYPKKVIENREKISFPAANSLFLNSSKLSLINAAAEEQIYALRPKNDSGIHRCRFGCGVNETAYHVATTCHKHTYTPRHDGVVYWLLRTCLNALKAPDHVKTMVKYNKAALNTDFITNTNEISIRAGIPIVTNNKLKHNKPDIVIHLKGTEEKIIIFEVAVSHLQNYKVQEHIKRTRYDKNSIDEVNHQNYQNTSRNLNLVEELRQAHKCPVYLGVLVMGCYGEILQTEEHLNCLKLLKKIDATQSEIQELFKRAAYGCVTKTAEILMRHLQR